MSLAPSSAMVFAAGFGTRMRPLTDDLPKPMIPLQGRPMIDRAVAHLRDAGIERIAANTHYLADRIAPHLASLGVQASPEPDSILDTGGGLRNALPLLGRDPVITLNPDVAFIGPNPVDTLLATWRPEMTALLLLVPLEAIGVDREKGDFSLEHGKISRGGGHVYTGAQILRTDRLSEIGSDAFSLNAYWDLLMATAPLNGTVYPGEWLDIGTPAGLARAERRLADV